MRALRLLRASRNSRVSTDRRAGRAHGRDAGRARAVRARLDSYVADTAAGTFQAERHTLAALRGSGQGSLVRSGVRNGRVMRKAVRDLAGADTC